MSALSVLDAIPTDTMRFTTPPMWSGVRLPKSKASEFTYTALNDNDYLNVIAIDMDQRRPHPDAPSESVIAWEDAGTPPNAIVENVTKGTCHYIFALARPVYRGGEHGGFLSSYHRAVSRAMTMRLGGDLAYTGVWQKNPASPAWRVHEMTTHRYTLDELRDRFGTMSASAWRNAVTTTGLGRNHDLFHALRDHAIRNHQECGRDLQAWRETVVGWALKINDEIGRRYPAGAMDYPEVRSVAKSVANWIITDFTPRNRGVMRLDATLDLCERQRLGAEHTAAVKSSRTTTAIANARRINPTATQAEIAKVTCISLSTVKRYWKVSLGVSG